MAGGLVIGVDLGGTKLLAGVVDDALHVHHRAYRLLSASDASEVVERMVSAIAEDRQVSGGDVEAVGVGLPSLMDAERGVAVSTVHQPLQEFPFRDVLAERLGLPVFVDNDANVALLAEHAVGAARGARNAVLLTLGTGIGGAVIVDGRLMRGATGAAGELGHTVIDVDGPRCVCGNVGCLEMLVSGPALASAGARVAAAVPESALAEAVAHGREVTGALVTELAHDGDRAARDVVALIGMRLGVGIANVINVFNPEVVVVGGGVMAAGEMLLAPARQVVAERALRPSRDVARIVPARFGEEAGMLGAALLAFEGIGRRVVPG
jgi:glucokinase